MNVSISFTGRAAARLLIDAPEAQPNAVKLCGIFHLPPNAKGIVIFAHGSGSSRLSPRNAFVAEILQKAGFGTLLFDLLTEKEDELYQNRFEIDLLTQRLKAVTQWLQQKPSAKGLKIGYFGASTGAAAALQAAADPKQKISAVVSRGGRPDLAEKFLPYVKAPTLLIVGGNDEPVIKLNKKAYDLLVTSKKLKIIPGATHLFEEPGALEKVANLAAKWFLAHNAAS